MSPTSHPARRTRPVALLLVAVLALASACGQSDEPAEAVSSPGTEPTSTDGGTEVGGGIDDPTSTSAPGSVPAEGTAPEASPEDPACRPGDGKTVTDLDDVVVEELVVEDQVVEPATVAGQTIPGFEVPGFTVPRQVLDGGCIIEYDAPAGCFGRVEIPGVAIPGSSIPGSEIPGIDAAGIEADGVSTEAVSTDAVSTETVWTDQVCQAEPPEAGGRIPSIRRPSIRRPSIRRPSIRRPSIRRPTECVEGECVDGVTIDGVTVPGVTIDGADAEGKTLEGRTVEGLDEVPVFGDDEETAYLAPADVLFDFDADQLRPSADAVLTVIAAEATKAGPEARISVDGHTDSMGDDAYNQDLSERRAQAVADWLVTRGGLSRDAITVRGFGETAPVAPNETVDGADDPAGRQQNRRVVIGVST